MSLRLFMLLLLTTPHSALAASDSLAELSVPDFAERQSAAGRILQAGPRISDDLLAARDSTDFELAAASARLAEELVPQWTTFDAPPAVRQLLSNYADLDQRGRLMVVEQLRREDLQATVGALCRIARFEPSPLVARSAAITLLSRLSAEDLALKTFVGAIKSELELLNTRYGPSNRETCEWLATAAVNQVSTDTLPAWRKYLSLEQNLLAETPEDSSTVVAQQLAWQGLRAALAVDEPSSAQEFWKAWLILEEDGSSSNELSPFLEAIAKAHAWQTANAVLADNRLELNTKIQHYAAADLRRQQGKAELADQLAQRAFEFATPEEHDFYRVRKLSERLYATELEERGLLDWAEREFRQLLQECEPLTLAGATGRWSYASLLYNSERYAEAAQVYAELRTAINRDDQSRQLYDGAQREAEQLGFESFELPSANLLESRQNYCEGLVAQKPSAAKLLRRSLELEADDADVLIAYYRAATGEEVVDAQRRIDLLAQQFETEIITSPEDPTAYNQWAWLIANTTGDFAKAVRYSERSLELNPGNPGHLDTLARCYYAAGELPRAIATQAQAAEKAPHIQALQRQLEFFRSEAKKTPELKK